MSIAGLFFSLLLATIGCATIEYHKLQTHVEYYASGELKLRYTYYMQDGHEVLHGKKEIWQANGSEMIEEYKDGILVQTYGTAIHP